MISYKRKIKLVLVRHGQSTAKNTWGRAQISLINKILRALDSSI